MRPSYDNRDPNEWRTRCISAESEVERLRRRLSFTQEWYSVRWQRIADELRDTDAWPRVACIMANGTPQATEPPTYAQQMNLLKHEVERLREALEKLHTYASDHAEYSGGLMSATWVRDVAISALNKDRNVN